MTKVLVTIDTEVGELGKHEPHAFATFVDGHVGGQTVGTGYIMQTLSAAGAVGEFFVDVYAAPLFGEELFAGLCQSITNQGHAVQLHTHPAGAFDPARIHLHQYSPEEQDKIIVHGVTKIKEWTGAAPIAHRAGAYGVNDATFPLLAKHGLRFDSSYFPGNSNCEMTPVATNELSMVNGVCEVPVTVFQQINQLTLGPIVRATAPRLQKFDFRYGSDAATLKLALDQLPQEAIVVLFLHSFNFLNLRYNTRTKQYQPITINTQLMHEFEDLIQWIAASQKHSFTRFADLTPPVPRDTSSKENSPTKANTPAHVPTVRRRTSFVKALQVWTNAQFFHTIET